MLNNLLEMLPFWGVLLLTILFILVPIQIGQRLGRRAVKRAGELHDAPIGSVVGAALGLLAFMLAFTFQITTNRLDTRKQLLLDEVGSIRDAYLRAALLPEPQRTESRKLLRDYVDVRVEVAANHGILHLARPARDFANEQINKYENDYKMAWLSVIVPVVRTVQRGLQFTGQAGVGQLCVGHHQRQKRRRDS
jgi:hypothetical protein